MASRGRRGREPEPSSGRPVPGQGDGPAGPVVPGWPSPSPGGWAVPGPDEPGGTDFGPETGHWDMDAEDDPDGDGTATWDGPMVWQDDEQGGTWDRDAGLAEGSGTWEADVPPTMYGAWGAAAPVGPVRLRERLPDRLCDIAGRGTGGLRRLWRPGTEWTGGRGGGRKRRRRTNGPWPELVMITAVAVIIAAVILAVTSADRTNLANSQAASNTVVPSTAARTTNSTGRPSTSAPPRSSSTVPRRTTTVPPSTTTPAAVQKARNLLVTAGVEGSLVRSWLATNPGGVNLSAQDVGGTEPGQVYYAEQPASATYWALVAFKPSATLLEESSTAAGQEKLAEFQNTIYAFSWKAGPVWTLLGEVGTGTCPGVVPAPVLKVWGMCGL